MAFSRRLFLALVFCAPLVASAGCRRSTKEMPEARTVNTVVHLETFVMNVGEPDGRAYLRIGIDLGLTKEKKKKEGDDSAGSAMLIPVARDVIIGVLGSAKADELLLPEGKVKLKADLLKALENRMPDAGIREIYFTEFLLQQ